ncbi:PRC-barrel domain-containing protein [Numidum massiliense]|uniref:PRC-barrel domain-containing protein n=1 Tax=Numidum massiliense TaxID=1522315 RepID=UPI0006D58A90|nr:PRC-barrel domain-containing protein [Numidum massiliense]
MRKSQDVIGLPVYCLRFGKQIGVVQDLLFNREQHLFGLLLASKGWFTRGRYIPADRIASLGLDAVTVDSEDVCESFEQCDDVMGVCSGQRKLKGLPVVTATGRALGTLENVYFMEEMGTLIGYELTDGLLSDLREGRKALCTMEPLTWGTDAVIVPGNVSSDLKPVSTRK